MKLVDTVLGWVSTVEHKTHADIIAPLQQMVNELQDYAAHHSLQTVLKAKTIGDLEAQVELHTQEAQRAVATATRIGGIIG